MGLFHSDFSNKVMKQRLSRCPKTRKRFPLIRILLVILLLIVTCSFILPGKKQALLSASADEDVKVIESASNDSTVCGRIVGGSTFYSLMTEHSVGHTDAVALYSELRRLGFGSLMAGDSFVVVKSNDSLLRSFSLRSTDRTWFHLTKDSLGIRGTRKEPQYRIQETRASGILENSLYESVIAAGEGADLVSEFVEILGWDINFFTDPRKGDRFDVLVEKVYEGEEFVRYGSVLAVRYQNGNRIFTAFRFADDGKHVAYYDQEGRCVQKMFLKAPLKYSRISSGFTLRRFHPVLHVYRMHLAVDYAAPTGTPVYAAADGRIEKASWSGGYGKCVVIRHGAGYRTHYGHLSRIAPSVKVGKWVNQKECIGYVGSTGLSTGPHLDYRVQKNGTFVNPMRLESARNRSIPASCRLQFEGLKNQRLAQLNDNAPSQFAHAETGK